MSKKESETVEDIVNGIREENPREEYPAEYGGGEVPNKMRNLADRIETAHNWFVNEAQKSQKMLADCVEEALVVRLSCRECISQCAEFTQDNCPYKVKWRDKLQKARKMLSTASNKETDEERNAQTGT